MAMQGSYNMAMQGLRSGPLMKLTKDIAGED
jgi:uncharacterized protein YhjY with autotransporter beta-barrel domain